MYELTKGTNYVKMEWYAANLKDKIKMSDLNITETYEKGKVINTIMRNATLGVITIDEEYNLIDGYKRVKALNDFITNDYNNLSLKDKEIFDNYELSIAVASRNDQ